MIRVLLLLLVAAMAVPQPAWATRLGSRRPHHHHAVFFGSAFYFGAPWYAYHYPPYYYGPFYEATSELPSLYVEKFEGKPDANSGDIYCPSLGQYYPDVQECSTGWQRIIRPSAAQGG